MRAWSEISIRQCFSRAVKNIMFQGESVSFIQHFLNVCSRGSIVAPSEAVPSNILNQKALLASIKPPLEDDAKRHSPLFLITRKQGIKITQSQPTVIERTYYLFQRIPKSIQGNKGRSKKYDQVHHVEVVCLLKKEVIMTLLFFLFLVKLKNV